MKIMELQEQLSSLRTTDVNYEFIDVFKNPNKLPITEVFIERTWRDLKNMPKNLKLPELLKNCPENFLDHKSEILPALDKKWLPKLNCFIYEPYNFNHFEDNSDFITQNRLFLDTLEYLLSCNYHQFWCTILFNADVVITLRSYLLNPVLPYQVNEIETEALALYKKVSATFKSIYERLLNFDISEEEYMSESYGAAKLIELKLLNLPIVITLAVLYYENYSSFVHKLFQVYCGYLKQKAFIIKEIEAVIEQNLIILQTLYRHIKGSADLDDELKIIPISLEKRPKIYSLKWIYSFTTYLLNVIESLHVLFVYHKPAVQTALEKRFPTLLPSLYVGIYKEIYELLREDEDEPNLFHTVMAYLSLSRWKFVEIYHEFVSFCLGEILKKDAQSSTQEPMIENYLKLLTSALDEEYFIYDYDKSHSVADQNCILEDCSNVDPTRTQFIVSCIEKLSLSITLPNQQSVIEKTFTEFVPAIKNQQSSSLLPRPPVVVIQPEPQQGPSGLHPHQLNYRNDVETKIQSIIDMFPYLGDAFVLKCLESYNFIEAEVINAILENNLPPHLQETSFDEIRIPPEPEPEKPILAYRGKKPEVNDALFLLDDKTAMKKIKPIILEGLQSNCDSIYDDEYDDSFDNDVEIKVQDNPLDEEFNSNTNRTNCRFNEEEISSEEGNEDAIEEVERNRLKFCEDPALLRDKREARFNSKKGERFGGKNPSTNNSVTGNAKGQGQSKNTLLNRQRKEANKSSMSNHNRKSGARWKRNKGMIPS